MSRKDEKARVKIEKKRAKARAKSVQDVPERADRLMLDGGVGVTVRRQDDRTDLVISGLGDDQVRRLLPQLSREVMIAVEADRSRFRAGVMRFVREGIFQTIVKIAAGLVVGYLLLRFGLR